MEHGGFDSNTKLDQKTQQHKIKTQAQSILNATVANTQCIVYRGSLHEFRRNGDYNTFTSFVKFVKTFKNGLPWN